MSYNHVCTIDLLNELFCGDGRNFSLNLINLWESNLVDSNLLTIYCTQIQIMYLLLCLLLNFIVGYRNIINQEKISWDK